MNDRPRERRRLAAFFILVFAVSWGAWWAAALGGGEWTSFPTVLLFTLGGAGPLIATVILVRTTLARDRRCAFVRRIVDPRPIANRWLIVIIALTLAPALAGQWLAAAAGDGSAWHGEWRGPASFAGIVAFNLVASLAEEPGWRGYAYDRARSFMGLRAASLLIGGVWLLWHVPLYFVDGTFQNQHGFMSQGFFAYSLALIPAAVIYGWVVARSGFSVLAAVVLHLVDNVAGEVLDLNVGAQLGRALILSVVAVLLWRSWRTGEPPVSRPRVQTGTGGGPQPPEGRVIASGMTQASNSSALT